MVWLKFAAAVAVVWVVYQLVQYERMRLAKKGRR